MADVAWSEEVEKAAFGLNRRARAELIRNVGLLRLFPQMGEVEVRGRMRGHRKLPVPPYWTLYYRFEPSSDICTLTGLRDMRRRWR